MTKKMLMSSWSTRPLVPQYNLTTNVKLQNNMNLHQSFKREDVGTLQRVLFGTCFLNVPPYDSMYNCSIHNQGTLRAGYPHVPFDSAVPICSKYGLFTYLYHPFKPKVGKYTSSSHGSVMGYETFQNMRNKKKLLPTVGTKTLVICCIQGVKSYPLKIRIMSQAMK